MKSFDKIIKELKQRAETAEISGQKRLGQRLNYAANTFTAIGQKDIEPNDYASYIDQAQNLLNSDQLKSRHVTSFYGKLINFTMKQYGYVPEKYYQNQWMAIGMAAFGLPFGVVFAMTLDNMAFIGIGFPMGLPIGMAIGASKDKKAFEEGKQLQIQYDF